MIIMSAPHPAAPTASASDPRQFSRPSRELKVLLMENIHENAVKVLRDAGFENIATHATALSEDDLIEQVRDAHYLGIRSRTRITPRVLEAATELRSIGCFCIGTNQVDIDAAKSRGVPVFNAPFSNTRSVAELVLAEAIMLLRDIPRKNANAHQGRWMKSATGSYEVRGKHLGIVGYGHIGSQVGLLAESLGMRVFFYDVESKLALGNATAIRSLNGLLESSDVVTLHVPEAPETANMIGANEIAKMRQGAALINASRGTVVDIDALIEALNTERLSGAALDVFPSEPKAGDEEFVSPLRAHRVGSRGEARPLQRQRLDPLRSQFPGSLPAAPPRHLPTPAHPPQSTRRHGERQRHLL
jgi:D-3-phosphoglycerate dehydrogenase